MSKLNILAAGVLFAFAVTAANAAPQPDPNAANANQTHAKKKHARSAGTPQDVLQWHEKLKMRREVQQKASAMRQQLILEGSAGGPPLPQETQSSNRRSNQN